MPGFSHSRWGCLSPIPSFLNAAIHPVVCVLVALLAAGAGTAGAVEPDAAWTPSVTAAWEDVTSLFVQTQPPAADAAEAGEPLEPAEAPGGDLSALAELERLLERPVVVPGPAPATLTDVGREFAAAAPPGFAIAPLDPRTPAAVTRIDYDQIWESGARSLNELLEIYVPNTQVIRHHSQPAHLGIRGIISDREDKYLMRVNDRLMNNRTELGAFSEHYLPLLGDIHHIDMVRGPGSATFGPGAIAGVVSVVTHNGLTFEGLDATVRQGFLEEFTATEVRYGRKFSADSGLFLYAGVADYAGADQEDSPYVFGRTFTARDNVQVIAGQPVTFAIPDDHRSHRSRPRQKYHAQYTHGNFDVWVRYTRSGEQEVPDRGIIALPPVGSAAPGSSFDDLRTFSTGYQQATVFTSYLWELSDSFSVDFDLSYDMFDFERIQRTGPFFTFREDEYYGRVLGRWRPVEQHSLALGFEYSHELFGLDSPGFPNLPAYTQRLRANTAPWETDTYSLLGEYRWDINAQWTAFLSGRLDKHTYSRWLRSPRGVLVYMPTEQDAIKFIAAESVRRIGDDELRAEFLGPADADGNLPDPPAGSIAESENLKGFELRYERRPCEHLLLAISGFYEDHAAVGFSTTAGRSLLLGDFRIWGLEPEVVYHSDGTRLSASHSYTKLIDATLRDPTAIQGISAAGYGVGGDLANWSNHISKLTLARDLDECWSADTSLRVYWGFPGGEDLTEYNNSLPTPNAGIGLSDPGYDEAFEANVYLNAGLECRPWQRAAIRLDLYNLLGWFDEDLNKRNYINRISEYRSEAAAIGLTMRVDF